MRIINRILIWISDLRFAIVLLLMIGLASSIGTAIPQQEPNENYIQYYNKSPLLGFINGDLLIQLQLDQVYSSTWFLSLLILLSISLIICSLRRQWPTLKAAIKWIDYKEPNQIARLALSESFPIKSSTESIKTLAQELKSKGWNVKEYPERLAARKGVIGRIGPPLVHIGLILLMIGSALGSLGGQRVEKFLAPGRSFNLVDKEGTNQLEVKLNTFKIERDPAGRTEQFKSEIQLIDPKKDNSDIQAISVNHPLRYKGITIYQADWSLAGITLQLSNSPKIQFPLQRFPELGEQIWGIVLPTNQNGTNPVLLSLSNETGPIQVFDENGNFMERLMPGGEPKEIKGVDLKVVDVIPASGLLLKKDPGVPIVYTAFGITLLGGALSILATKQIWAVIDQNNSYLHIGGLCNRNLAGLATEIPKLLNPITLDPFK